MKKSILLFVTLIGFCACTSAQKKEVKKAPAIIFDTDMGPDYDDAGAIAMLHYFADKGRIRILATMASTKYPRVAPVLSVFNTYFDRPEIPIGVPKGEASELSDSQKWSDTLVAKYPHALRSNDDAPDAVKLYRKILAAQPDNSVTIVTVGFFTNISNLLQSEPDEYSNLSGEALIEKKVLKMVSMAGKFPSGSEFNIDEQIAASKYVFGHWKKPVIFSGFEIGQAIRSGLPLIHDPAIKNSPVKDVFRIAIPLAEEDKDGRMSWDQTAVLVGAVGYEPYYTLQKGKITIADDGSNTWENQPESNEAYLVPAKPPEEVEKLINTLMKHQPKK
ncbi:MAG: nucleoside hydrolase [Mucilaginibacter polytrichastri]|nr:nucleoside hydrolase [Mucilaginibacter polytrichastri]